MTAPSAAPARITVPQVQSRKASRQGGGEPIVMITAYDVVSARLGDRAGADILLVGDSLGMVVLGRENTLSVTMDEMIHHARAVAAAKPRALVVGDMPYLSYHVSIAEAGVFSIVLEGIPEEVAAVVTDAASVPTIGIGAGPRCDGQVLVFHDLLGLTEGAAPRFVRRYADLGEAAAEALARFSRDVRSGLFPSKEEAYHLAGREAEALRGRIGTKQGEPATDGIGRDGSVSERTFE